MNYEEQLTTMEAPDGDDESNYRYLANITIPAVFVTRSTADALKSLIKASAGADGVYVSMDWTDALPRQKRVAWEFWTNSNDQCGPICDVQKGFIKEFVPVAKVGYGWWWLEVVVVAGGPWGRAAVSLPGAGRSRWRWSPEVAAPAASSPSWQRRSPAHLSTLTES